MKARLTTGRRHIALVTPVTWVLVSGCTSMSGLDGTSDYACKAPPGVTCDSVSGNYANAIHHNLPSQRAHRPADVNDLEAPLPTSPALATARLVPSQMPLIGQPLRSQARVLRLWFKPWEDADHDLYDQGYVYVQIDSGQWLVEHIHRQIRDAYAPLRPPAKSAVSPSKASQVSQAEAKDRQHSPSLARPEILQRPASVPVADPDDLLPPLDAPADAKP